jgi:hypothetical protein
MVVDNTYSYIPARFALDFNSWILSARVIAGIGISKFVGSAVAFRTLHGAKFTVTYSVDATNDPTK